MYWSVYTLFRIVFTLLKMLFKNFIYDYMIVCLDKSRVWSLWVSLLLAWKGAIEKNTRLKNAISINSINQTKSLIIIIDYYCYLFAILLRQHINKQTIVYELIFFDFDYCYCLLSWKRERDLINRYKFSVHAFHTYNNFGFHSDFFSRWDKCWRRC